MQSALGAGASSNENNLTRTNDPFQSKHKNSGDVNSANSNSQVSHKSHGSFIGNFYHGVKSKLLGSGKGVNSSNPQIEHRLDEADAYRGQLG